MRHFGFAAVLIAVLATRLAAFEIEDHRLYTAPSPQTVLRVISTTDAEPFEPLILAFQAQNPTVTVDYTIASSAEVMKAVYDERAPYDLAISSAMDLQTKIANDGLARSYSSSATEALPQWAKWRNQVFAFTQEPAVLVVGNAYFGNRPPPANREELIAMLRDEAETFHGKVGTYDVRQSGIGYLFATQDSRNSESFWRLTEVMGRMDARLYCCSGDMIDDVASGKLAIAYNVLGSYAERRVERLDGVQIVAFNDFLSVMLRTALIPSNAENPDAAHAMIDFLAGLRQRPDLQALSGLPAIDETALVSNTAMRPIRLGPGLLVFLDRLKRESFLRSWTNAIEQK